MAGYSPRIALLSSQEFNKMSLLPKQKHESSNYWQGSCAQELRYQECQSCQMTQFPPSLYCNKCGCKNLKWLKSSGEGFIVSITTVFRPPSKYFKDKTPYDLAIVELAESFRIMVNVNPAQTGKIGSRIKIVFEERSDGVFVPQAVLS